MKTDSNGRSLWSWVAQDRPDASHLCYIRIEIELQGVACRQPATPCRMCWPVRVKSCSSSCF